MSEPVTDKGRKTGGGTKALIGVLALLIGVIAGAAGFYLIALTPRANLAEQIEAKTQEIESFQAQLDSLKGTIEQTSKLSPEHEAILTALLDPEIADEVVTLGKEVGGKWQVNSVDDVYFLGGELVFVRIDDGHIPAAVLLRIPDHKNPRNWRMLWGDYD
ncbi:hypothetical protein CEE36_06285 [candidate division TA06 bacterium B3_TA06]|uniref:Uncharacterized protein n=1 Tax=candidate division TA06 bacterium B3_TA06 TaxID=2012487 RepID=A0A532V6P9_UNCT6|nr:MAG: hypothetical protein CEE36_06285 [candidate division TA06 bacterium B3_TA06]